MSPKCKSWIRDSSTDYLTPKPVELTAKCISKRILCSFYSSYAYTASSALTQKKTMMLIDLGCAAYVNGGSKGLVQ